MQMGHDTENMVGADDLEYAGIICSPVNRGPEKLESKISEFREKGSYDILMDSQLYVPRTNKGKITEHSYFPEDYETADHSNETWWNNIADNLSNYVLLKDVNGVTSPIMVPKKCSSEYYAMTVHVGSHLFENLKGTGKRALQSCLINVDEIEKIDDVMRITSIVSQTLCTEIYLIFQSNLEPRREICTENSIKIAQQIIMALEHAGKKTLVAFCSSDMCLYKAAGASACATGKYFNLRRFTKGRFEDDENKGGQQIPYWFEEGLMGFIREADLLRLKNKGLSNMIKQGSSNNVWADKIINHLHSNPGAAWNALGWKQFLSWFSKAEKRFDSFSKKDYLDLLKTARNNWASLEGNNVFFDEPKNKGEWLGAWLQSIADLEID